jgi:hypothetical protein
MLVAAPPVVAQPANDDCASATVIAALPFTDGVDTAAATTEAGDPSFHCGSGSTGPESRSVWYRYTSASGGSLEVDTFGSDYDTLLSAWRGTCGAFTLAMCSDDDLDAGYFGDESRLIVSLTPGETVYIEVTSDDLTGGNLVLSVKTTPIFQATDDAENHMHVPDIAAAADGTFLVVWARDDPGGLERHIVGRRYCDTGVPIGDVFQISPAETYGRFPRVARTGDQGFVVVWQEGTDGLLGRRVTASGVPVGGEFEVTPNEVDYFGYSALDLAADAAGNFVVAWSEWSLATDDEVLARRFDASGGALGPAFAVNTYTTEYQNRPSVTSDAGGNFVVSWQSDPQDGDDWGIFGRRFDATGNALGGEFQINTTTSYSQWYPAVAGDPSGNFVVVWHDVGSYCGTDYCLMARRYDAAGMPLGGEFAASPAGSGPFGDEAFPDADANASGDFVVAWVRSYDGPLARPFAADGSPLGPATPLSHVDADYQYFTKVAVADDGDFVVVWDWTQFGSHYTVMGRAEPQNPSCPAVAAGCPATPRTDCKEPTIHLKGKLTLRDTENDKSDALTWKWVRGEATTVPEIGDPLGSDSYAVCLYDGDDALLLAAVAPPGGTCGTKPCWKDLGGLGFRYVDKAASQAGVNKVLLKSGDPGKAKVIVKGKGMGLPMPVLPPTLPLRAQLISTTGACWDAEFRAAGVVQSSSTLWSGKPHVGSPSGAFVAAP